MRFHSQHGDHVVLEDDHTKATRIQGFCEGVVFSREPISVDTFCTLTVTSGEIWGGVLSLGLTSHNPSTLTTVPKYVSPHLSSQNPSYWTTFISEEYLKHHNRLTFYVSKDGEFRFVIEEQREETTLTNLPVTERLWLMIDIYGSSSSVKLNQQNDVPLEIYSKGPEAVHNFTIAKNNGFVPTYRTRLMLIGNDQLGRSILKRNLCRNIGDVKAKTSSIPGLEVSGYYVMDLIDSLEDEKKKKKNGPQVKEQCTNSSTVAMPQSVVETTFYQILALNISRSVLMQKSKTVKMEEHHHHHHQHEEMKKRFKSTKSERNSVKLRGARKRTASHDFNGGSDQKEELFNQLLVDLPQEVSDTVRLWLQDVESKQLLDLEDNEKFLVDSMAQSEENHWSSSIAYDLWDLNVHHLHYDLLQFLFSPRAIYIVVFDLDCDLDSPVPTKTNEKLVTSIQTESQLDVLMFWMNCIHAYATPSVVPTNGSVTYLTPPVILVGTYQRAINDNTEPNDQEKKFEETFLKIQDCILDKPFCNHVVRPFFALQVSETPDIEMETNSSQQEIIIKLQNKIRDVVSRQYYYGEEMSTKWLRFEEAIMKLREDGFRYADLTQVQEIARTEGIETEVGQRALFSFYHDIGLLMHFSGVVGTQNGHLILMVILDPLWLIEVFNQMFTLSNTNGGGGVEQSDDSISNKQLEILENRGLLEDSLIQQVWHDNLEQKKSLLETMAKLDLISKRKGSHLGKELVSTGQYYFPSKVTTPVPDDLATDPPSSVVMYFDFLGFLPDGLFHRLLIRTIEWTQDNGGANPVLYKGGARFNLDESVDFTFQMQTDRNDACVKVRVIMRTIGLPSPPNQSCSVPPYACAKVRNFLESTLADLRELWMKRLAYKTNVSCPCDRICTKHSQKACRSESCKHFLLLDDCLANNVVLCEYRRVNTSFIRKRFPRTTVQGHNVAILPENVVMKTVNNETVIIEGMGLVLYQRPSMVDAGHSPLDHKVANGFRTVAKILNGAHEGRNWTALAQSLGYRPSKIDEFNEDLNSGLALITDWIFSSGNTSLSMDMLISCLKQLESHQAMDILQEMQDVRDETPVFVSYQWDAQDQVVLIRNKLEQFGIHCWMDVGQMGGGDLLYNRIYRGISRAKVVLTCVTPKYVVSHNCTREVSLADLLGKPVIPVMVHPTPWPPPGPLALLFSQLVYIDMCGIGGHGGTGYHADWEDRFQEILNQISKFVAPVYHLSPQSAANNTLVVNDRSSQAASLQNFVRLESGELRGGGELPPESQLQDDEDLGSGEQEERLLEDYGMLRRGEDETGLDESQSTDESQSISDGNASRDISSVQPQVTKCIVCIIL